MSSRLTAELVLLLCVVIWSGNFTMTKLGLGEISPLAFFLLRFTLGAAITTGAAIWQAGPLRFARKDLPLLVGGAIVGIALNQMCFMFGLSQTSAANSALLVGTTPIWAAAFVTFAGQERVPRRRWLLVATGLVGVGLIVVSGRASGSGSLLGDLLSLGVAITWGAYTVIVRPLMHRYSATLVSAFMMVVGTVALMPIAIPAVLRQDFSTVTAQGWAGLLYASLLSVTLTNILYFRAIHRLGASRAALYGYLEPFLGVLIAVIVLQDSIGPAQIVGGAIVVASVAADRHTPEKTRASGAEEMPTTTGG